MLEDSGLLAHYRAEREGADRVENLEELVNAAESFVMQEGFGREAAALTALPSSTEAVPADADADADADAFGDSGETLSPLVAFLTHAALEAGDNMAQAGQDAIQLMTVHSAKGLEFDCVFITGMEEGLFPHENSFSDRAGLEEERRLAYVAITRARQRLYLTHSQTRMLHGQTRYNLRSRFFEELPPEALKWLTPQRSAGMPATAGWSGASGGGRRDYGSAPPAWSGYGAGSSTGGANSTATIARKEAPTHGLQVRQKVFHAKFGEGTVLTLEGSGNDARAQINFPRHGIKWLALSVAKLTLVP